jgi:hypothetical protein
MGAGDWGRRPVVSSLYSPKVDATEPLERVGLMKAGPMFILTDKIELPRRVQIFNDCIAEDAARKKRENDDRWLNKVLDAIATIVRSARK